MSRQHDAAQVVPQTVQGRLLSAELRGDEPAWRRLRTKLSDGTWLEVMPVAFALAARRRLGAYGDRRIATRFARSFVAEAPRGAEFSARDVEALIRGACGEDHLVAEVSTQDSGRLMYAALFALVDDLELDNGQLDQLLVEAEEALEAAYQAVDVPPSGPPDAPVVDFGMHRRAHRRYLDDDLLADRPPSLRRPRLLQDGGKRRSIGKRRQTAPVPATLAGRYLRALLLRKPEERDRLGDVPSADVSRLQRKALPIALTRYLHPDPDVREIAALVKFARDTFDSGLDLMKTEYVARIALGEGMVIDGISAKDTYVACSLLLVTIAHEWGSDDAAVSAVILEAEDAAAASGHRLTPFP